jgi:hypothetical protein
LLGQLLKRPRLESRQLAIFAAIRRSRKRISFFAGSCFSSTLRRLFSAFKNNP